MRRFLLNKLVRDHLVDSMKSLGQKPQVRRLKGTKLLEALKAKIIEETRELDVKNPKSVKELADVLEAVEQLATEHGVSFEELRTIQAQKREKAGGFEKGLFVGELKLQDNDKWVEYYASDPKRFPEVKRKSQGQ